MNKDEGLLLGHFPCFGCGGSDPLAIYKQSDGTHTGYCFSNCGYVSAKQIEENFVVEELENYQGNVKPRELSVEDKEFIENLECRGWPERKLAKTVNEKYGVKSDYEQDGKNLVIKSRYYPIHDQSGSIVGYKQRTLPKEFKGIGNTKATNKLFGEEIWESGGKCLCITTGEEDALALAQTLHTIKGDAEYWTPVVSVTAGDGSIIKQLKSSFEFINSFEKVILFFDMDE